ncbi:unnamed protein product [Paramecium pentaurelia]|uniref:Uncharacterized protein n=1 Tax=Paramecium pentaurelia TaxID=43138 RepID=A0A8S1TA18_9CILI|nr:unnamed protein product [Paramecium pentaurelia]
MENGIHNLDNDKTKSLIIISEGIYSYENKIGKWIELEQHDQKAYLVIYDGQYQNGIKIEKWDILYRNNTNQENQKDYTLSWFKKGQLIDLNNNFCSYLKQFVDSKAQIHEQGEQENNRRVGNWKYMYKDKIRGEYEKQGWWQGQWIIFSEGFSLKWQEIYNGAYQNDKSVLRWDVLYKATNSDYFILGLKNGQQIKLRLVSHVFRQLFTQHYMKVGRWNINYRNAQDEPIEQINGFKAQILIDIRDGFRGQTQIFSQWRREVKKKKFGFGSVQIQQQVKNVKKQKMLKNNYTCIIYIKFINLIDSSISLVEITDFSKKFNKQIQKSYHLMRTKNSLIKHYQVKKVISAEIKFKVIMIKIYKTNKTIVLLFFVYNPNYILKQLIIHQFVNLNQDFQIYFVRIECGS